jgi:hypothetical protein
MHYIVRCRSSISFCHNLITSAITNPRKLDQSFTDLLSQAGRHTTDEPNGDCRHDDRSNNRPKRKFAVSPASSAWLLGVTPRLFYA